MNIEICGIYLSTLYSYYYKNKQFIEDIMSTHSKASSMLFNVNYKEKIDRLHGPKG